MFLIKLWYAEKSVEKSTGTPYRPHYTPEKYKFSKIPKFGLTTGSPFPVSLKNNKWKIGMQKEFQLNQEGVSFGGWN